jgi:hypothetical protein
MKRNKLLSTWRGMHNRCYNKKQASYIHYGARGITVDPRWHGPEGYKQFVLDMGQPAEGQSLERTNNDKPYSSENCKWASKSEQANNKRNNRWLTANGETKTMAQWSQILGCKPSAILYRLNSGMSEEAAVTTPIPERPNSKLTIEQVRFIRDNYPMRTLQSLADEIGVSKKTVMNVVHGKIFKDVV